MTQEKDQLAALQEIRHLMERSARFTSLSGLSGIVIGLVALAGVGLVKWHLNQHNIAYSDVYTGSLAPETGTFLVMVALGVLVVATASVIGLTWVKAQKDKQSIWHHQGQRLFINLCIPLAVGGVFCLVLAYHDIRYLITPSMLIFYGLALIHSSKYTFPDIHYLGLGEIALGVFACFQIEHGLVAWAVGFGGLNMLYGAVLHYKYEKKQ